jgi:hypothetical protein
MDLLRCLMPVSFSADIRPLVTDTDIDHMSFFCGLSNFTT